MGDDFGVTGYSPGMSMIDGDVDPFIAERIIAIRDRFGLAGLRAAEQLIDTELLLFADAEAPLGEDTEDTEHTGATEDAGSQATRGR